MAEWMSRYRRNRKRVKGNTDVFRDPCYRETFANELEKRARKSARNKLRKRMKRAGKQVSTHGRGCVRR